MEWKFYRLYVLNVVESISSTLRTTFLSASGNRLSWENHDNMAASIVPDSDDIQTG